MDLFDFFFFNYLEKDLLTYTWHIRHILLSFFFFFLFSGTLFALHFLFR